MFESIFPPHEIDQRFMHNERGIEAALCRRFLYQNYHNITEVGAVTPYYIPIVSHPIIDPYDEYPNCIRQDAEYYDLTNKDVLCISTIEHLGTEDYGNKDIDKDKPIRFIEKLQKEANSFLLTFPLGSNKILDNWSYNNIDNYQWLIYGRMVYDPPVWVQMNDATLFNFIPYNKSFPNAAAIAVIYKNLVEKI